MTFRNVAGIFLRIATRLLSNFLWPELNHINVSDFYFQADSATCHITRENIQFLRSKFRRVISRNADFNWILRSCDLTTLDFFCGVF